MRVLCWGWQANREADHLAFGYDEGRKHHSATQLKDTFKCAPPPRSPAKPPVCCVEIRTTYGLACTVRCPLNRIFTPRRVLPGIDIKQRGGCRDGGGDDVTRYAGVPWRRSRAR